MKNNIRVLYQHHTRKCLTFIDKKEWPTLLQEFSDKGCKILRVNNMEA